MLQGFLNSMMRRLGKPGRRGLPTRLRRRPTLETLEDRVTPSSSTVILPISDFLAQQGSTMVFTPPVRDQLGWTNSTLDPGVNNIPSLFLMVDYTGQAAQYLSQHGIDLHTKITGFVTETPIGTTGQMEVTVNLKAKNALTWAANIANVNPNQKDAVNTAPLELGYRAADLVANPSLTPALSDINLQLTFQEQAGAPLPDVAAAFNENMPPPGFVPELFDVQSWGKGTLAPGNDIGPAGQTALVYTTQVADLTNASLPGTLGDGFWQEPVDIVPLATSTSNVGYLNGTLFVTDQSGGHDNVIVVPSGSGGATVISNLGTASFAPVTGVVVGLGGGHNNVVIAGLPGATVDVTTLGGHNNIVISDAAQLLVHLGGDDNHVFTGNTSPAAQFVCVAGGDNRIDVDNTTAAVILVAGNGDNHISASGAGDSIEVVGNGCQRITDTGTSDVISLGGDGNADIDNQGMGSITHLWGGKGHKNVRGPVG